MKQPDRDEPDEIARAAAGDVAAFGRLAARHADSLFRCALVLSGDRHWAEDLAQETLVEAWQSLGRFDGRCRLSTWLYGILRHRFLKGRQRQQRASQATSQRLDHHLGSDPSPAHTAEMSEDAARIRSAVASLPQEHRLVVELRFFAAAHLDEIAAALDCPLGTVKSRLHHGLEKLRQMKLSMNLFASPEESRERET